MARQECLAHSGESEGERMNDWADEKAREYNVKWWKNDWPKPNASLAALLREAAAVGEMVRAEDKEYLTTLRSDVLAEVRRVVEGVRAEGYYTSTCDEILSRLGKV